MVARRRMRRLSRPFRTVNTFRRSKNACLPTPLGEVVNGLMMEHFQNIINVEFTAGMEAELDEVEEGKIYWKRVLEEFYKGFHQEMEDAEEALKDTRLKVPDEVTEETCDLCGRNLVVKSGRFGKFLACPGYPECKFTKPIVERMPGRCPRCGSTILKRKSKRGYAYYACERGAECGFMTWDVPTENDCPECGQTMFKRSGRGAMKPFCINPDCKNFLPEEKRGYRKKACGCGKRRAGGGRGKSSGPSLRQRPDTETTKTAKSRRRRRPLQKSLLRKNSERKNGSDQKRPRQKDEKQRQKMQAKHPKERIAPEEEGRRNMMVTVIGAGSCRL